MKKKILLALLTVSAVVSVCFMFAPSIHGVNANETHSHEFYAVYENEIEYYKCTGCEFSARTENAMPAISPFGTVVMISDKLSFSEDVLKVYTERWNIKALQYGVENLSGEEMFSFALPGGGYDAHIRLSVSPDSFGKSSAIVFKIDLSDIRTETAKLKLDFYAGVNSSDKKLYELHGDIFVSGTGSEKWAASEAGGAINYIGKTAAWVYVPFTSIKASGTSSVLPSMSSMSELNLAVTGAGNESATKARIGDIYFVSEGETHSCVFEKTADFNTECEAAGFELYNCTDCGTAYSETTGKPSGHSAEEFYKCAEGSFAICDLCGRAVNSPQFSNKIYCGDDVFTVTFDYGAAGGRKSFAAEKGHIISSAEIPYIFTYENRFLYQFNRWTSDPDNIIPLDPVGYTVNGDVVFYAAYVVSSYDNYRYDGLGACQAKGGGQYSPSEGKAVFYGNSNYALWYTLEKDMAPEIDAINNSVDGSTTYDMVNFLDALVIAYKPKICILNLSSNDNAYHHMTDKAIIGNVRYMYERIRKYSPETVIVFMNGNPLAGRTEFFEQIKRVNNKVKTLCDEWEMCEFIDVYDTVLGLVSQYPKNWDTWTHFNANAYSNIVGPQIKAQTLAVMNKYGIKFN